MTKPSTARRYASKRGAKTATAPIDVVARGKTSSARKTLQRVSKAGRGAAKGAAFERHIAKMFSLWVSGGKNPDLLWRSAGSGGRSTMRRKQTGRGIEYHASDIAPLHPDAAPFVDLFTLECKNYASIDLHQLFYSPATSTIGRWWAQACRDAASVKRWPLMVIKELRHPELVVFKEPSLRWSFPPQMDCVRIKEPEIVLVLLSDLLQTSYKLFSHDYKIELPLVADDRPASDRKRKRLLPLGRV